MKESDAPQSEDNTADHSNNPKNRGAVRNLPPRVGGGPPSPPEHHNPNGDSGQAPWWRQLRVWTFIGEVILIAVTVRIACIYSAQLGQMIGSNKITHDALILGQRAWVGVNGIPQITEYRYVPETGYVEMTISFSVKNYGLSPAFHLVPGREVRGGNGTLQELQSGLNFHCAYDRKLTDSKLVEGGSGYALFPGNPHTEPSWKIALSKGSYDLNKPGYLIGCITYRDQFGDTKIHHTELCYHTRGTLNQIHTPEEFEPCFWGNNAD